MQKETEIKLRVSRATLEALQEHPLLKKRNKSGWERRELYNQYYDTPGRELARAKVALRMRRDGEQYIQTLKSRGQSVAGLSERNEWDWYLEKNKLDLKKLDDKCWPAALKDLDKKQLKPIFSTDFVRQRAEIAWGRGKARVVVEAALDLGKVVAGDNQEEICELELELRQGDAAALLELAAELAADLPLMPCDISKAERGYRLFDPNSYEVDPPAQKLLAETPLDGAFAAIAWYLLGSSQRLAEQYRFNGHWRLLEDWLQHLQDLRTLLGSLGQAVPRASSRELREALDALLADWAPRIERGRDDETLRQQAPQLFRGELDETRWGLFSLNASRWLLAPIYMGLSLALLALTIKFFQEIFHVIPNIFAMAEADLILVLLSLIDMALVGGLLVMVMISGYENFVSQLDIDEGKEKLSWLGKMDSGSLKNKVAASIVAISSIHLLRIFMDAKNVPDNKLMWYVIIHMTFVLSAFAMGYLDKQTRH